jgi:hypothetical protein
METPNFRVEDDTERRLILQCATRAEGMSKRFGEPRSTIEFALEIAAAHNEQPLDLARLVVAGDTDFAHDVYGIARHLQYDGTLGDCFRPRYAKPEESK